MSNCKTILTRIVLLALAATFCTVSAGCVGPEEPKILRIFPEPPAEARFYLRKVVKSHADYHRPGLFDGLVTLIAGESKQVIQRPQGVAWDGKRVLYVVDQEQQGIHIFDTHSGKVRFVAAAGKTLFVSPVAAAWHDGRLAVSDNVLNKVFILDADGELQGTVGAAGAFGRPTGLAFDPTNGDLYVADTIAARISVYSADGRLLRQFGEPGREKGQFNGPTHLCVTADGKVVVSDTLNYRVQVLDRQGKPLLSIGKQGDASGHMALPKGVGVDSFGHIYVADSGLATVQVFDPQGQYLLGLGERGDGPGQFEIPSGLGVVGNMIFACDFYRGNVQIFEYIGGAESVE